MSSLFPSQVRNQIYRENEKRAEPEKGMSSFLKRHAGDVAPNDAPIAQVFEATTIMFADIAGFTKWSSSRGPTQVFELLETYVSASITYQTTGCTELSTRSRFVWVSSRSRQLVTVMWRFVVSPRSGPIMPWSWHGLPGIVCSKWVF